MMRGILLLIVLALGPWCTAQASFKVVSAAPPAPSGMATVASVDSAKAGFQPLDGAGIDGTWTPTSVAFGTSAVSYTGTAPSEIEVRRGMGKDVRLSDALKQIAPPNWRGFGRPEIAQTFNPSKTVSWVGGMPWTAVLDRLARAEGLSIEVDWTRKHLYVGKRVYGQVAEGGATVAGAPVKAQVSAAPIVPAKKFWTAKVGSTVRETVTEWAASQGWIVHWPMADLDYRIAAPLTFDGSLVDAVTKLTLLYENAERPLAVNIQMTQRLIRYSEKN